jgi:REP element-mobilizing transposase RayT
LWNVLSTDDAVAGSSPYGAEMPRRPPINPEGYYHVGSRGCYGRALFRTPDEHELFLMLYARASTKYGWKTLAWTLLYNHHHFVVRLTTGGLSDGMREVHSAYSRRINALDGQTGKGHLVRHAFFARELVDTPDVLLTCRYVDLNESEAKGIAPEASRWSGYRATVGLEPPRTFHQPDELLRLVSRNKSRARAGYQRFVHEGLVELGQVSSPNQG